MKSLSLRATAVLAAAAVATGAVAAEASAAEPASPAQGASVASSSQEDRDLFEALYMGTGPRVAELKTKLADPSYDAFVEEVQASKVQRALTSQVMAEIDKSEPGAYARFASGINSGDPLRGETALRQGSASITRAVKKLAAAAKARGSATATQSTRSNSDKLRDIEKAYPTAAVPIYVWQLAVLVQDVGVAVQYGAAVNAAVAVNVAVWKNAWAWSAPNGLQSRLDKEQYMAEIVQRLS